MAKKAKAKGDGGVQKKAEPPKPRPLAIVIPKEAGVKGNKNPLGWTPGETRKDQKVDCVGDGESIDDWLNANAAAAGKTQEQWLKDAVGNINKQGGWMKDVPAMNNSADVKGVLDGLYADGARTHGSEGHTRAYNDKVWPMWKAAGAKHDSPWQYQSSMYEYTGKTKMQRTWDPALKSWVDVEVPVINYVDPNKVPFLVRSDAPTGSIFKATYNGKSTYLMVADAGTNKAEMSSAALKALGIEGNPNAIPAVNGKPPKVDLQYLGMGDKSKLPTADSIKKDGERLEKELADKKAEQEKKKPDPKGKGKHADAQKQGGAFYLAEVLDHGVVAGENKLLVAVAHPSCLHSGGKPVCTGSNGIFVGVEQSPLAGEDDKTEDDYYIKKGTGDQTILMT